MKKTIVLLLTICLYLTIAAVDPCKADYDRDVDEYLLIDNNLEPITHSIGVMVTLLEPKKIGCSGCPSLDQSPLLNLSYRKWLKKNVSYELLISHYKNSQAIGVIPGTTDSMFRALPVSVRLLLDGKRKGSFLFSDKQLYIGGGFIFGKADLDAKGDGVHYRVCENLTGHEFVVGFSFINPYKHISWRAELRYISMYSDTTLGLPHVSEGGQAALDTVPVGQRTVTFNLSGPTLTLAVSHHF